MLSHFLTLVVTRRSSGCPGRVLATSTWTSYKERHVNKTLYLGEKYRLNVLKTMFIKAGISLCFYLTEYADYK